MQPGDVISERYRLHRLLDVGGMGEVWAAKNELTQKQFAIKFLLPNLAERPDALERFVREAETAGRLNHKSIVDVFDVAQAEDGRPYIVMELLVGESLEARLEREGTLTSLEAAAFLAQVADGLDCAHRAGIVHRDLSLANVFLVRNPDGGRPIPKILDFGVSKTLGPTDDDRTQTGHGTVLGCPEFMSPEQARGAEAVDARTDVWSLGIVLYRCLAGTSPFRAKNYNALMVAILTRPHRPLLEVAPQVDPELLEIVEGCLQKDREHRIQSAREVANRLTAIARRLGAAAGVPDGRQRRATDRLPKDSAGAGARKAALGVDEIRQLEGLRARRTTLSIVSAVAGIAVGAIVALAVLASRSDVSPEIAVAPPSTVAAPVPAPAARPTPRSLSSLPMAAAPKPGKAGADSRDLAVAVARGLRAPEKPRH
ncbi:MAG TPA: serine/threonine-protein kinase [Polyangiaceae bacterium]|nr:serine/threonine-protein kinase [Polyangiaceae bacterium]